MKAKPVQINLFWYTLNQAARTLIVAITFYALYKVKSAAGIDLIPGWSLFH